MASKEYYQNHKEAVQKSNKKWRDNNKEKWQEIQRNATKRFYPKYYAKVKAEVFSHYCPNDIQCAVCGSTKRLSIDHINGNGNKHLRELGLNSSYQFYLWLKKNHYPNGFRILCLSCNSHIRGKKGYKCQRTSQLIETALKQGLNRAKDIIDWGESDKLTRRAIHVALYRLVKQGKIIRIGKGIYQLAK
jgi:hypothetical protein